MNDSKKILLKIEGKIAYYSQKYEDSRYNVFFNKPDKYLAKLPDKYLAKLSEYEAMREYLTKNKR